MELQETEIRQLRQLEAYLDTLISAEEMTQENYLKTSIVNYIPEFQRRISEGVYDSNISSGFEKLDSVLDGGFYEGLYIIRAISSLGKTTFIMQICDQIAQNGHDVLIFSLEMAKTEIMAKSISRHTLQQTIKNGGSSKDAKTARGITDGKRYINYSLTEEALITEAIENYSKYAQHIYIKEGVGDIGVEEIRDTIKEHIQYTGNAPFVVIDYIQILSPYNDRTTDKQNTDKAVLELKRMSRDYKIPIIGISSLNRENYSRTISMQAFKESGAIEYSSDVLIGLQLEGCEKKGFNVNEAKRQNPRNIQLVILKNRK